MSTSTTSDSTSGTSVQSFLRRSIMASPCANSDSCYGKRHHFVSILGLWIVMTMSALMVQFEIMRALYEPHVPVDSPPRVLSRQTRPTLRTMHNPRKRHSILPEQTQRLDFFITGFPKCGTTTLLYAFGDHNETSISTREHCAISNTNVPDGAVYAKLNDELKDLSPAAANVKRGIKCPQGLKTARSLERLQQHSPDARLIIGVRHPIHFMQSYYNYRITEIYDKQLDDAVPPIESLIGGDDWKGVSTDGARFELFLMQLGKTNMTTSDMNQLLGRQHMSVKPNSFKVFLYSLDQLEDSHETRSGSFRNGLENFLELDRPLKPIGHENLNHFVGDKAHKETIDICQREYRKLRRVLVTQAQETHRWIRDEFLESSDVMVANKEHFLETLQSWNTDPCPQVFIKKPSQSRLATNTSSVVQV